MVNYGRLLSAATRVRISLGLPEVSDDVVPELVTALIATQVNAGSIPVHVSNIERDLAWGGQRLLPD